MSICADACLAHIYLILACSGKGGMVAFCRDFDGSSNCREGVLLQSFFLLLVGDDSQDDSVVVAACEKDTHLAWMDTGMGQSLMPFFSYCPNGLL